MPKYLVTRTRYFEQTDTVMVEAPDAPSAQTEAKTTDSPIDHEYLTHAPELYVTTRVQPVEDTHLTQHPFHERQVFSRNLERHRKLQGMTIRYLAQLTGLSDGTVHRACHGGHALKLENAAALAHALGLPLAAMLTEPEPLEMAA